jgi:hypothetical protein
MLGYLQQNWGLSIYFEAISNGKLSMLRMLSWSKDPSWRREEKEEKKKDELTVHFVDAPDEMQRKSSEDSSTGWYDGLSEDTVGLSDDQFESRERHAKTKSSAPDEPTPWSRGSVGQSDGRVKATRDVLAAGSLAPNEPLCQRIFNGYVTWRAPDEPTPRKRIASIHLTLPFSVVVSQRLFGFLGLFIPPPLTHFRRLDCVDVQRSSRHLEDHIQSIQVLNCSPLDLHMLSVCA